MVPRMAISKAYAWSKPLHDSPSILRGVRRVRVNLQAKPRWQARKAMEFFEDPRCWPNVVIFTRWLASGDKKHPLDASDIRDLVVNGPYTEATASWVGQFAAEVVAMGGDIEKVFCDIETTIGTYYLQKMTGDERVAFVEAMMGDDQAVSHLPVYMRHGVDPGEFASLTSPIRNLWNQFANGWLRNIAVRRAFQEPIEQAVGHKIEISNYKATQQRFAIYSSHDKIAYPSGTVDGVSSPNVYFIRNGTRYAQMAKDPKWGGFQDALNRVNTSLAAGVKVVPWLAGYRNSGVQPTAWDGSALAWHVHLTNHLAATGAIEQVLVWNPQNTAEYDQQMEYAFAATQNLPVGPYEPTEFARESFDREHVTTGGYTTIYGDLVAA